MNERKILLLREITKHGNVSRACRDLDIPRQNWYWWQLVDKAFAEQACAAIQEGRNGAKHN